MTVSVEGASPLKGETESQPPLVLAEVSNVAPEVGQLMTIVCGAAAGPAAVPEKVRELAPKVNIGAAVSDPVPAPIVRVTGTFCVLLHAPMPTIVTMP